ncbi:MAG TPA: nuclear transport factor 2 family protein [Candidatus Limnocylindria bacterium]
MASAERGPCPQYDRQIQVRILDVPDKLASVKVVSEPFVDYLHLAKIEGRWWIVNVLYEDRDP